MSLLTPCVQQPVYQLLFPVIAIGVQGHRLDSGFGQHFSNSPSFTKLQSVLEERVGGLHYADESGVGRWMNARRLLFQAAWTVKFLHKYDPDYMWDDSSSFFSAYPLSMVRCEARTLDVQDACDGVKSDGTHMFEGLLMECARVSPSASRAVVATLSSCRC